MHGHLNVRMISEWRIGSAVERNGRGLILIPIPKISMGLKNTRKRQDNVSRPRFVPNTFRTVWSMYQFQLALSIPGLRMYTQGHAKLMCINTPPPTGSPELCNSYSPLRPEPCRGWWCVWSTRHIYCYVYIYIYIKESVWDPNSSALETYRLTAVLQPISIAPPPPTSPHFAWRAFKKNI